MRSWPSASTPCPAEHRLASLTRLGFPGLLLVLLASAQQGVSASDSESSDPLAGLDGPHGEAWHTSVERLLVYTSADQALSAIAIIDARHYTDAAPELAAALGSMDDRVVKAALVTLVRFSGLRVDAKTAVVTRTLIRKEDPEVRILAARIAGAVKDDHAIPDLIAMIGATTPDERNAAAESLEKISGERIGADAAAWSAWWAQDEQRFQRKLPRINEQLASKVPDQIAEALVSLRNFTHHPDEVGALVEPYLDSPDPMIRNIASQSLPDPMRLRDPAASDIDVLVNPAVRAPVIAPPAPAPAPPPSGG
ncbi:MAG: HEAT repeat domain-containing protein, partial [Planctomycetes bacterium]|nr:HEAT repeat domain-containing protein [Planctomycetota bacterium]